MGSEFSKFKDDGEDVIKKSGPLGAGVRYRLEVRKEKKKVLDYVINLEVLHDGKWKECVRYDARHEGPHCDVYNLNGEDLDLEHNFPFDIQTGYRDAQLDAENDIIENWRSYRNRFLQGKWPRK